MTVEVKQLVIKSNIDNSPDTDGGGELESSQSNKGVDQQSLNAFKESLTEEMMRLCKSIIQTEMRKQRER